MPTRKYNNDWLCWNLEHCKRCRLQSRSKHGQCVNIFLEEFKLLLHQLAYSVSCEPVTYVDVVTYYRPMWMDPLTPRPKAMSCDGASSERSLRSVSCNVGDVVRVRVDVSKNRTQAILDHVVRTSATRWKESGKIFMETGRAFASTQFGA